MGFDVVCGFGDALKGAGRGMGEALSKVTSAFSIFKQ
tara:strand:- start:398 stop:508 length:111 start_codon:yes stop_codon:yes gene_type:complete